MIKKIALKQSCGRIMDREPFVVAENEQLELEFQTEYKIDDILITVKNSNIKTTKPYRITGNTFIVPREFYIAGLLYLQIDLLLRGETVKSWTVEPIVIKELHAGFEGVTEIDELKSQITHLEKRLADLEDKHKIIL